MISRLRQWYHRRQVYKQTYRELSRMTDYELQDLGLDRSMVDQIANEAAYGKEGRYV
jgi:uncharacterized protein YjiS (DUF1127 family)